MGSGFLNEQLRTMEVLAIEVATFEAEGTRVLRAKTIGQTQAARAAKDRPSSRLWNRDDWLEAVLKRSGPSARGVVDRLLGFVDSRGLDVRFGKRPNGSLQLGIERPDAYVFPFFIYPDGGDHAPVVADLGLTP